MKLYILQSFSNSPKSHPARGAWIEMTACKGVVYPLRVSHPARGAWIEIDKNGGWFNSEDVAPRKGCVD